MLRNGWFLATVFLLFPGALSAAPEEGPSKGTGNKTLMVFWRYDCAPCLREINILREIAAENPALPIQLISLQDKEHSLPYLPKPLPANVTALFIPDEKGEVLKTYGDDKQALPYSIMKSADNSVCAHRYGVLGTEGVKEWARTC